MRAASTISMEARLQILLHIEETTGAAMLGMISGR
jgi:hypothetical protein